MILFHISLELLVLLTFAPSSVALPKSRWLAVSSPQSSSFGSPSWVQLDTLLESDASRTQVSRKGLSTKVHQTLPTAALCLTGRLDVPFEATVSNMKSVLLARLADVTRTDVFVNVKIHKLEDQSQATDAFRSLSPTLSTFYTEAEPTFGDRLFRDRPQLWIQRYQWLQCWEMILRHESNRSMQYDFVIRTRPDILYSPKTFFPDQWTLWKYPEADSAYGLCKCGREDLTSHGKAFPVQDVFFVGPRHVAAVFMTTWNRREEFVDDFSRLTSSITEVAPPQYKECYMYSGSRRDAYECLSILDLMMNDFQMHAIPETAVAGDLGLPNWSVSGCEVETDGNHGFWAIFHRLPIETQACIQSAGRNLSFLGY